MQSSGQHHKLTTNVRFSNEEEITTENLNFRTLCIYNTTTSHGIISLSKHAYSVGTFPKVNKVLKQVLYCPIQQLEKQSITILQSLLMYQYISVTEGGLGVRQLGLYFWFWKEKAVAWEVICDDTDCYRQEKCGDWALGRT